MQHFERLTKREERVISEMTNGLVPLEIAEKHGVSVNTVRSQCRTLYSKLGVNSALGAVRAWRDRNEWQEVAG